MPRYSCCYREGSKAAHLYILLEGKVNHRNSKGETTANAVPSGSTEGVCFGFECLMNTKCPAEPGQPTSRLRRRRTTIAADDCIVLQVSADELHLPTAIMNIVLGEAFAEFVQSELMTMPIFDGLDRTLLRELAPLWTLVDYATAGNTIFQQGDAGDKFFILSAGRVAILRNGNTLAVLDAERNVNQSDDGRPFFGEMALMDGLPRMAGVEARSPCTLLVMRKQHFAKFNHMVPDFKARLRFYKELRENNNVTAKPRGPRVSSQ